MADSGSTVPVPKRWDWLFQGFCWYVRRYLKKHFNAVRLSLSSAAIPDDGKPVIVVLNHPSWWDPLLCTVVSKLFNDYEHFGAIEDKAIQHYPLFNRLGFFGVDTTSLRGAADFLKVAQAIVQTPRRAIWITAQGHFADVRQRPLNLKSGVGHLAARLPAGWVLPVAFEYVFWNEKNPEALIRIGTPIAFGQEPHMKGKEWTERIEQRLTETLDQLNAEALRRDPALFRVLIGGRSGVGGLYDLFRRSLAWLRGRRFDARHEAIQPEATP